MIDGRKTGAYISRLRKSRDWTQLELAERLNVTPQAVSRWETGDSYPDIGLLPQIAEMFGISVDELLNGEPRTPEPGRASTGAVIEALARGEPERVADMLREDRADLESLIEAAPLARPSVVNRVVEGMSGYTFTNDQIAGLAPFLGAELLESLVLDANPQDVDSELLGELAPFLNQETLDRLVQNVTGDVDADRLESLAPFLSHTTLERLVDKVLEGTIEPHHLANLAPFLSTETLDRLVARLPETELGAEYLTMLAPFVRSDTLEKLANQIVEGTLKAHHIGELAPFLKADALDRLLERVSGDTIDTDIIQELAPFVHASTLEQLVNRLEGPVQGQMLVALAPFLRRESLTRLVAGGSLDPDIIVELAPFLDRETLAALIRGRRTE